VAKATTKKKARAFKPRLKPVPQPRKLRARAIPNSLFARTLDISDDQAISMLRGMYRIRHVENALFEMSRDGRLTQRVEFASGLEASTVGACSVLRPGDRVVRGSRGHGHLLARGLNVKRLLAEICGRAEGICGGHAGSLHATDCAEGIFGTGSGPAANLPFAAGLALAAKQSEKKQVVLCFAGTETAEQGLFHETLSLAAQWDLPLVIVCEYAGPATRAKKGFRAEHVWERAQSYCAEGLACDGLRVLDVREAVGAACDRARSGGGPTLVEAAVHFYPPHSHGAEEPSESELERWKTVDPISQFRLVLAETETVQTPQADAIEREVMEEVKVAVKFALEQSRAPDAAGLLRVR